MTLAHLIVALFFVSDFVYTVHKHGLRRGAFLEGATLLGVLLVVGAVLLLGALLNWLSEVQL